MSKEELEDQLLDLTRQLTGRMIPYSPPLKGDALARMYKTNPEGYKLLMKYLELEQSLTALEEESILQLEKVIFYAKRRKLCVNQKKKK